MQRFHTIDYEVTRGRAHILLNRPNKHNAISLQMQEELHAALWDADDNGDVHAVKIAGVGPSFSGGYDLLDDPVGGDVGSSKTTYPHRATESLDDDAWHLERAQRLRMALFDMHKPVVAQIHGYCLAGATDIALLCDILIASEDAVIGFPPARDFGALPNNMWLYNVGPQWAKRLLLTGDTITGAEAAEIGLVLKAVPRDLLEGEVDGLLDRMQLIDADLLSANKRIVNLGLELMGARTLQRLAAENDARAHRARSAKAFRQRLEREGIRGAIQERDAPFGDGKARVRGPEVRDDRGFLTGD